MNFKELLTSKTAWTGLISIAGGIFSIFSGEPQVGVLAIIGGLGMIFVKDAIVTNGKGGQPVK